MNVTRRISPAQVVLVVLVLGTVALVVLTALQKAGG
jgi:hypothetical protein